MATPRTYDKNVYFATLTGDEFIGACHARIEDFYQDLLDSGVYEATEKSVRAYYGARLTGEKGAGKIFDSTDLKLSGKKGEIINLKINHYRSLIKHSMQLATSTKPAYACRATNSDYRSQTQATLGNGLLDFYLREKKLQRILTQTVENALVTPEGWVHCPWNAALGEMVAVDPDTGAKICEGDLDFSVHSMLDVVRDIALDETTEPDWLTLRTRQNRFNLAARYPEHADRILALATANDFKYEELASFNLQLRRIQKETDYVTVWTFYHKKTDAMPEGRLVVFVGDVILIDGPMPYRKIPLHRLAAELIMETPYGYTPSFDLLGPQQGLDILNSTIITNQGAHGVQSIWTKAGDPVTVTTLEGGMKNLQSEEMPQPLQLTKTAPEVFQFRKELVGEMETLYGVSATVRGNPEANLKSGSALALVVSQSIQFASLLEAAYNTLFEDVGTDVVMQLRDFSKAKRVANILGEAARPFRKEFTGDDLSEINRVVVEATSPLSKTISGRMELADNLLEKGFIETPKQYITVLTTGQLDPAIEGIQNALLSIRAENEDLRNGKPVRAVISENHLDHVREHKSVIENPEAKKDAQLIINVTHHMQEHISLWRQMDPAMLAILNMPPPPPPPPPSMPPQMGAPAGGPPPGPPSGPQGAPPAPPAKVLGPSPQGDQPAMPNMPSLPKEAPPEAQAAFQKIS